MWSGSSNNIPSGWYLCDGTNNTPDLRNRFIVGSGGDYSIGNTGGESSHTLTLNEMPSHKHDFYAYSNTSTTSRFDYLETDTGSNPVKIVTGRVARNSSSDMLSSVGGGQPFENRPPYYALAFIMKG